MQMSDTIRIRATWVKKGDPPCDHPRLEREYQLSAHTGDSICTTCGRVVDKKELQEKK